MIRYDLIYGKPTTNATSSFLSYNFTRHGCVWRRSSYGKVANCFVVDTFTESSERQLRIWCVCWQNTVPNWNIKNLTSNKLAHLGLGLVKLLLFRSLSLRKQPSLSIFNYYTVRQHKHQKPNVKSFSTFGTFSCMCLWPIVLPWKQLWSIHLSLIHN